MTSRQYQTPSSSLLCWTAALLTAACNGASGHRPRSPIKVAVCQMRCVDGDREGNLERIEQCLQEAGTKGADLACFPEAAILGWVNPEAHRLAAPIPGATTEKLAALARKYRVMLAIGLAEMDGEVARLTALRDRLWSGLQRGLDDVVLNGHPHQRLCNTLNVSFPGVESEALMTALEHIAVSSGSACTSASVEPSFVLKAIGLADDLAHASLRFTIGRFTTVEDVDFAAARVVEVVQRLRGSASARAGAS